MSHLQAASYSVWYTEPAKAMKKVNETLAWYFSCSFSNKKNYSSLDENEGLIISGASSQVHCFWISVLLLLYCFGSTYLSFDQCCLKPIPEKKYLLLFSNFQHFIALINQKSLLFSWIILTCFFGRLYTGVSQ